MLAFAFPRRNYPRIFELGDALPMTAPGKILKKEWGAGEEDRSTAVADANT